jgi:hypothetical protein
MALVNVPTIASASASKQIVITPGGSTSVLYTVPAGKTFTGVMVIWNVAYPQVNGVYVTTISSWTAGQTSYTIPMTLVAGTTIQNGGATYPNWTLIGIES